MWISATVAVPLTFGENVLIEFKKHILRFESVHVSKEFLIPKVN